MRAVARIPKRLKALEAQLMDVSIDAMLLSELDGFIAGSSSAPR
jgi:hypothetical protein